MIQKLRCFAVYAQSSLLMVEQRAIINLVSKLNQDCLGFALLRCDWSRRLALHSQPIRNHNTNLTILKKLKY